MTSARPHRFWYRIPAAFVLCQVLVLSPVVGQQPAKKAGNKAAAKPKAQAKSAAARAIDPYGRPEGSIVDQTARYYLWYSKQTWHLRTTAKGARQFHGVIRLKEAKIKSCKPIGLTDGKQGGKRDAWQMNDARSELKFSLLTGKMSDGFDLGVDGDGGEIEFELHVGDGQNPKAIFIGKERKHPATNPFTFPAMPQPNKP